MNYSIAGFSICLWKDQRKKPGVMENMRRTEPSSIHSISFGPMSGHFRKLVANYDDKIDLLVASMNAVK